jgi:hypothetical protein
MFGSKRKTAPENFIYRAPPVVASGERMAPTLERVAKIESGQQIAMLEDDLYLFGGNPGCCDWAGMVDGWLQQGASLDILAQAIHPTAVENVTWLKREHRDKFRVYKTREGIDDERLNELLGVLKTFHFTVFRDSEGKPYQAWIEDCHRSGEAKMYNCELIPPHRVKSDPRFMQYWERTELLRKNSNLVL